MLINNSDRKSDESKKALSLPSSKKTPSSINSNKNFIFYKLTSSPTILTSISHSWNWKKSTKNSKNVLKSLNLILSLCFNKENKTSGKFKIKPNTKNKNLNKESLARTRNPGLLKTHRTYQLIKNPILKSWRKVPPSWRKTTKKW